MADILIRGMEMPKENDILVFDVWHGKVYARSTANTGTKSYEVISLPEGHGELIDGERFRVILCRLTERQDDDSATHALRWAIECLDKLESLVDAEEENK